MKTEKITTRCLIAGGGPAGIMLGFLLARAGIETIVLEKWPDFFRDFRGDTIHPSTMQVLDELGLLDEFLKLPHDETQRLVAKVNDDEVVFADFSYLHTRCPFIAFIPQWDFLNFLVEKAKRYPTFHLLMNTEATDLIEENGHIRGVRAKNNANGIILEITADLTVAADGRHSTLREQSGLALQTLGAPMDVLWFRLSRKATDPQQTFGRIHAGRMMVMLERGDYWQCGFLIRKGAFANLQQQGLDVFKQDIIALSSNLADRAQEIKTWEQIKFLEVTVNRLKKWYRSGLLCIGDAAHAMSPIGGVGINLAIQDAVASANALIPAFQQGTISENTLSAIQKRRELPTRFTQGLQVFIQNRVIDRVLGEQQQKKLPLIFKLLNSFPFLRAIPAYLIGIGIRPEHIKTDYFCKP